MISITMTELQRNPKLISQASEEVQILDKRKNTVLWVYTPMEQYNEPYDIMELAGSLKLSEKVKKETAWMSDDELLESAWDLIIQEKYGEK